MLAKKHFTLKKLLELLHSSISAKDKVLETDPNLEGSPAVHRGTEKSSLRVVSYVMKSRGTRY